MCLKVIMITADPAQIESLEVEDRELKIGRVRGGGVEIGV